MAIDNALKEIWKELEGSQARLVGISKTKPNEDLVQAYEAGLRLFGENKVQEMADKMDALPQDIDWHMVGHLQRNKVKYIAEKVALIHSVDSLRLLRQIDKEGQKVGRAVPVLLQMHIAEEGSKFGLDRAELEEILSSEELKEMSGVRIEGLMGMATNTEEQQRVRKEFAGLKALFDELGRGNFPQTEMKELSMGMTQDYPLALENGATLIRIGSKIFGARDYS